MKYKTYDIIRAFPNTIAKQ